MSRAATRRRGGSQTRPCEALRRKEDPSSVTAFAVPPSPRRGEGFSGGWKPPLHDSFGLFVGARFARPPVLHRVPLFRQSRRDTTVGCSRPLDTPAAAAQTGEPGVVPHPRRTPVPGPRPASPASGDRGKADCGTQAKRMWSRGPAGSVTRRLFGSFLDAQKGTRPAGRNPCDKSYNWDRDGRRKTPHPSRLAPCHLPPSGGKALGAWVTRTMRAPRWKRRAHDVRPYAEPGREGICSPAR